MSKILVADDEVDLEMLIKQKFRKQIRDNKYEFVFALNGVEALEKLKQHPDVAIVLSDINMPDMDGLHLLNKLTESNPLIKTVMVSAYGDMENIRTAMNRGAFDFVVKPVNFDDLELTIEKTLAHVNQLKQTVEAIKQNNILKMYVDENVLNFMSGQEFEATLLKNETINATIVFIDICSFTLITETEPADQVVKLLNCYFDVMVQSIIGHQGYVDKFIGDAIMAVFKGDRHLDRAIDACINVRKNIDELANKPSDLKFFPKVAIGINTGEVISGNIGSENLKRLDYTVIGDVVNTAQRLQSAASDGQIMVTEATYEKIKDAYQFNRIGDIPLKNKTKTLTIYEILN